MFEQMPQPQPKKEFKKESLPPEELFGSNIFEVEEGGGLKRVSEDVKPAKEKEIEIPEEIKEEALKYAKAKAWFARTPKEAEQIEQEAIKEYYKIKAKEIERIKNLEEKKARKKSVNLKEEVIELTEEVK